MGGEDLLEKEVMTQSSILAWEIPWIALVGYSPWGRKGLDTQHPNTRPCIEVLPKCFFKDVY